MGGSSTRDTTEEAAVTNSGGATEDLNPGGDLEWVDKGCRWRNECWIGWREWGEAGLRRDVSCLVNQVDSGAAVVGNIGSEASLEETACCPGCAESKVLRGAQAAAFSAQVLRGLAPA